MCGISAGDKGSCHAMYQWWLKFQGGQFPFTAPWQGFWLHVLCLSIESLNGLGRGEESQASNLKTML